MESELDLFGEQNERVVGSGGHFTKYGGGGLVPKARENFLIWIPEIAFAAFWEHIL
jgi:hypothetical protein